MSEATTPHEAEAMTPTSKLEAAIRGVTRAADRSIRASGRLARAAERLAATRAKAEAMKADFAARYGRAAL